MKNTHALFISGSILINAGVISGNPSIYVGGGILFLLGSIGIMFSL